VIVFLMVGLMGFLLSFGMLPAILDKLGKLPK